MANLRIGRRSGLVLRGGRNVRATLWANTPTTLITISAAGTSTLAFSLNAAALALRPFTIVRERLHWYVRSDVVTGGEVWGGAVGGCVVSDQASNIGVTAVPTPITDQGSDLFHFYDQAYGRFGGTQVEEVGITRVIDSKAMRKVDEGFDSVITFETPVSSLSLSMVSAFGGRTLFKLH